MLGRFLDVTRCTTPKNDERDDQRKAQEEMEGDHQHVEEGLLGRPTQPGHGGHAGQVDPIGAEECEADQDAPQQRPETGADGGRIRAPEPIPAWIEPSWTLTRSPMQLVGPIFDRSTLNTMVSSLPLGPVGTGGV